MTQVLIVDDQTDIRRLLSVTLSSEFSVQEASDGAMALQMIRRLHPQIVLLDLMMPGEIDGFHILRNIRSDPLTKCITVAILSARTQLSDHHMADNLGADAYFSKPFSPMQVKSWIRSRVQQ